MESNIKRERDEVLIELKILDKRVRNIIWISLPILILLPILTTQLDWFCNFTETGQIGDTIGGLTAPVIGVVSALLIYFSFRAQINANRIVQIQINDQKQKENDKSEFNNQMEVYKHLKESLEQFKYVAINTIEYNGTHGISEFLNVKIRLGYSHNESSDKLFENILILFTLLIDMINNYHKNTNKISFIHILIGYQFNQCIWDSFGGSITEISTTNLNSRPSAIFCCNLKELHDKIYFVKVT